MRCSEELDWELAGLLIEDLTDYLSEKASIGFMSNVVQNLKSEDGSIADEVFIILDQEIN